MRFASAFGVGTERSFLCGTGGHGMNESEFFKKLRAADGRGYLAGGAVRDMVMGRAAHDRDYLVCGMLPGEFSALFPDARRAGKSFPVFLLEIGGAVCEVAFARVERKTGRGYTGFEARCGKEITVEQDLARRDTTINSMAADEEGRIIDPYGGVSDIRRKIIRATSAEHFAEDPVRALRAARQAAQFGFGIEPATLALMGLCAEELRAEPAERKFAELQKALASPAPSRYFRALLAAGLLSQEFSRIAALIGKSQPPEYHPEGDAFEHTMMVVDRAAAGGASPEAVFAALMHDVGKGTTPEDMLPHHYGHEERGLALLPEIAAALKIPKRWRKCAEFVIKEHMRASLVKSPAKLRDLVRALENGPISRRDFEIVVAADNGGKIPDWLARFDEYLAVLKSAAAPTVPERFRGAKIGEYIRNREAQALKDFITKNGADESRDNS